MTETRERLSPEERARRQRLLMTLGEYLYGPSWQDRLSTDLTRIAERDVPRVRVNQWANGAKPIPAWMLPVMMDTFRWGSAALRMRALEFDAIVEDQGTPPVPKGDPEPEVDGRPPQESGPAAAEASGDDAEVDIDGFLQTVCSEPPRRLQGEGAMPEAVIEETILVHSRRTGWTRQMAYPLRS